MFRWTFAELLEEGRGRIAAAGGFLGLALAVGFNWFQPLVYNPTIFNRFIWVNIVLGIALFGICYALTDCAIRLVTQPHRLLRVMGAILVVAFIISIFNYATSLPLTSNFAIPPYANVAKGANNLGRGVSDIVKSLAGMTEPGAGRSIP